jgi:GT2 family glycosyltransferase
MPSTPQTPIPANRRDPIQSVVPATSSDEATEVPPNGGPVPPPSQRTWIVLLNWNGVRHLEYCLPSLLSSQLDDAHILLVDNASTDGSVAFAAKFTGSAFTILQLRENMGWAGGNNAGIRYAASQGAQFIALLNNDMMFSPNWLADAMKVFEVESDAGFVGSRIVYSAEAFDACAHEHFSYRPTNHIDGCCLIVRRDVFDAIGLIDEEYFIYSEEDDLEERAFRIGFRLFESSSPVWHREEGTMQAFPSRKSYLAMRNTMLFFRRFRSPLLWPIIVAHIFLCAMFKHYRKHNIGNRRYYASTPLANFIIFLRALSWNLADCFVRGPRGQAIYPRLDDNRLS